MVYRIIKISDFGLAKLFLSETKERKIGGTGSQGNNLYLSNPGYTPECASPEQEMWDGVEIDQRSDIFSFGIIMIELITSAIFFKELIGYYNIFPKPATADKVYAFQRNIENYVKEKRNDLPEQLLKVITSGLKINGSQSTFSFNFSLSYSVPRSLSGSLILLATAFAPALTLSPAFSKSSSVSLLVSDFTKDDLMLDINDKQISATKALHMLHDLPDNNVLTDKLFNADVNQTNTISNF